MALRSRLSQRLQTALSQQSMDSARRSLEHYAADELERFGLEAGIAIETLAKLMLFQLHPSLIVEGKDRLFKSLLLVLDRGDEFNVPEASLRTIGAAEATQRAAEMFPALAPYRSSLALLVDCRNGVAHLGLTAGARVRTVAGDYVRALQVMCKCATIEPSQLFGERIDLADTLLKGAAQSAEVEYAKKSILARRRYEDRYGHLDYELEEQAVRPLIAPLEGQVGQPSAHCPVCGNVTSVIGDIETDSWQADEYDDSGNPVIARRGRRLVLSEVRCLVCELYLEGWAEIQAAGIELIMDLPDEQGPASDLETEIQDELYQAQRLRDFERHIQRREEEAFGSDDSPPRSRGPRPTPSR